MRLIVLVTASVIAFAAPLRAWCEATCLAPAHHAGSSTTPHCPTAEPASDDAKMSAGDLDDCPLVDAARPTTFAKLDLHPPVVKAAPHSFAPSHQGTRLPEHLRTFAPSHLTNTPLRI
jgi:hypothetical protein